jgi:hypothetical protein
MTLSCPSLWTAMGVRSDNGSVLMQCYEPHGHAGSKHWSKFNGVTYSWYQVMPDGVVRQAGDDDAIVPPAARLPAVDDVNHPSHYTSHPSGVECIQVTEHMGFNIGNAVKYLWRADLKHDSPLKDLRKALWYVNREIERLSGGEEEA